MSIFECSRYKNKPNALPQLLSVFSFFFSWENHSLKLLLPKPNIRDYQMSVLFGRSLRLEFFLEGTGHWKDVIKHVLTKMSRVRWRSKCWQNWLNLLFEWPLKFLYLWKIMMELFCVLYNSCRNASYKLRWSQNKLIEASLKSARGLVVVVV